ncbi:hypothetical protein [Micromonospora sp. NPDC049107]|uniref:hypothetical protein n=1 Tax=unclassified Micromonospora TaxID=2617518 RepID=UPI0033FF17CE
MPGPAPGLHRIGQAARIAAVLPVEDMLPAVGAGTIVITTRTAGHRDHRTHRPAQPPAHRPRGNRRTRQAAYPERTLPQSDRQLAQVGPDQTVWLLAAVDSPDGSEQVTATE